MCDHRPRMSHITGNGKTVSIGTYPIDWHGRGEVPRGLKIEATHEIGPLSYLQWNEVAQLNYRLINQSANTITFITGTGVDCTGTKPEIVPFLPHVYFEASQLTRLYGLDMNDNWIEVFPVNQEQYCPSRYHYRAMAWMRSDLGWGVALYSKNTIGQTTNFVAQKFPQSGVNNFSVIDQGIGSLAPGASIDRQLHMLVGNLEFLKGMIRGLYLSGY